MLHYLIKKLKVQQTRVNNNLLSFNIKNCIKYSEYLNSCTVRLVQWIPKQFSFCQEITALAGNRRQIAWPKASYHKHNVTDFNCSPTFDAPWRRLGHTYVGLYIAFSDLEYNLSYFLWTVSWNQERCLHFITSSICCKVDGLGLSLEKQVLCKRLRRGLIIEAIWRDACCLISNAVILQKKTFWNGTEIFIQLMRMSGFVRGDTRSRVRMFILEKKSPTQREASISCALFKTSWKPLNRILKRRASAYIRSCTVCSDIPRTLFSLSRI